MPASMWSFGDRRRDNGSCTVISGIAAGQPQDSNTEPTPEQTIGGAVWESCELL